MSATIADLQKPDTYLYVQGDGDDAMPQKMVVKGHNVLVKLLDRPDKEFLVGTPENGTVSREAQLMMDAFRGATYRNWATVLAVGPLCDTPRTKEEMRERWKKPDGTGYFIPRCLNNRLQPGDYVCCEDNSIQDRMWNTLPCGKDTVLIDEAHIMLKIPQSEVET